MRDLSGKKIFVVMRHEKSVSSVWGFASALGAQPEDFGHTILERHKDSEEAFKAKLDLISEAIKQNRFDVLVLATKVNDIDETSQLVPFLEWLKEQGIEQTPVVMTHLSQFSEQQKEQFSALGMNLHWVEDDNLGFPKLTDPSDTTRTGMSKLGPVIATTLVS